MKNRSRRVRGSSYIARVKEINEIYETYLRTGLPNREILRRHIWPKFKISERTFYSYLTAAWEIQQEEAEEKSKQKEEDRD